MTITPRQHEYLRLAATFLPRHEIARRLNVSHHTVDTILNRLFKALGVQSRREVARILPTLHVKHCNGGGRASTLGLVRGDKLQIVGGRFEGFHATYFSAANSTQVRVQIGGGVFAINKRFIERRKS